MSKQNYNWKRFWCSRSGRINLADGGYLWNPDEEHGRLYNPDVVSLEAIADIPCLVLLGEPGIGKSRELKNIKLFTEENNDEFSQVLELNLRSCTNLKDDLFRDEKVTDWLAGSHHLYLFLDSLDEGLLSIPNLAAGLIDELKKTKYQNHIDRLSLRLACRTFVFPASLEEELKELWEEANFAVYELVPLRRTDVIEAAKTEGFSPDNFLKEINYRNIVPLAIKPITLNFLLSTYRRHNGQFPPDQKLYELYLEGCRELCTEPKDKERHPLRKVSDLLPEERLIVAARIAAITIFSNRFTVWSGRKVDMPSEDVFLDALCYGYENLNGDSFEITDKVINEVLDTGLFSSRGLHRMGWAHQTYAEFLAAWYLTQRNLGLDQIVHLIEHLDGRVVPQLHETVAWLASIRPEVFQQVMETDPDVLLQSDLVSTSETYKALLVENLLKLHDQEKLNRSYYNYTRYKNLNHPNLPEQLKPFIFDQDKRINARITAIDIAEACNLEEFSIFLADIAINDQEIDEVRLKAAIAVCEIGSEESKAKLKLLAILKSRNEFEDELKGCGLRAGWPCHITIEEVLNTLSSPKSTVIGGRYQDFIARELGENLQTEHLLPALQWLEKHPTQRFSGYPFAYLADDIIRAAWKCLNEDSQIMKSFSRIAFQRLQEHRPIIDADSIGEGKEFKQLLEMDSNKRLKLTETIISIFVNENENISYLAYSNSGLIRERDFSWLIEKLKDFRSEPLQQAWAQLIRAIYKESDFNHVNTILEECQENVVLESEFSNHIQAIDIDSSEAQQARESQEELADRRRQEYLDPPPKERVLNALSRFESGEIDAWWHLCRELTLLPTSIYPGNLYDPDLTNLPGWKEADEETKYRIVKAAKLYVIRGNSETHKWLGKNSYYYSALAGYKALQLLLNTEPALCHELTAEVWQKWTPIILSYPSPDSKNNHQYHRELCQNAYKYAPYEFLHIFEMLTHKENTDYGQIQITRYISNFWDNNLTQITLNKLKDITLTAKSVRVLLEALLQHGSKEARDFAESLITSDIANSSGEAQEKAINAACALMLHTDDAGWAIVWPVILKDPEFGQQVLETVSYITKFEGSVDHRLDENCLADLYIFLIKHYPDQESEEKISTDEEEIINPEDWCIGPEDSVKMWRSYIPQRLQERGTKEACKALKKIIHELPELKEHLQWRLLEAETLTRRATWQPPTPEEFLQFVISQEPSNLDLSNQLETIDQRTKKMEDEPKIENRINISNSPNSPINAPIGTSGVTNSNVNAANSDTKKGVNWGNLLTVIGILVAVVAILLSMSVSGAFNAEFKEWFNQIFPSKIEQQPAPESE